MAGNQQANSDSDADLVLGLNAAEERLQLAVGRVTEAGGVSLLAGQEWTVPGQAMRHLLPALQNIISGLDLDISCMSRLACVRGPGSFTGIRLALATALGLSRALDKPLAGVDYLPLLAAGALPLAQGRPVWVLTHARRNLVHIQGFSGEEKGGAPLALGPAQVVSPEAVVQGLVQESPPLLLGSGFRRYETFFAERLPSALFAPSFFDHPALETLLAHALAAQAGHAPVEPLYLRQADAEENLATIARSRGLDPEQARERLDAFRG